MVERPVKLSVRSCQRRVGGEGTERERTRVGRIEDRAKQRVPSLCLNGCPAVVDRDELVEDDERDKDDTQIRERIEYKADRSQNREEGVEKLPAIFVSA